MSVHRSTENLWVPPGDLWLRAHSFMSGPRAQLARSIAHVAVVAAAGALAFQLRFEFDIPSRELTHLWTALFVWVAVKTIVFRLMRVDRSSWSHTSVLDVSTLALANLAGSLLSGMVLLAIAAPGFPRSVYVLDLCLCLLGTAVLPLTIRLVTELSPRTRRGDVEKRIVIYGAGARRHVGAARDSRQRAPAVPRLRLHRRRAAHARGRHLAGARAWQRRRV